MTDRVRRGVVASTKGRWPRHVEGGATVNATVDERDADMGGGAVFHDNRVEIERLRRPAVDHDAAVPGARAGGGRCS